MNVFSLKYILMLLITYLLLTMPYYYLLYLLNIKKQTCVYHLVKSKKINNQGQ